MKHLWLSRLSCGIIVAALGCTPALAQKCVDSGRPGAWLGHCNPSATSSGRTITIWIEQPPEIIMGPPRIVWVRPSAAGASQTASTRVDNPTLKRELTNNATTGYQLFRKGAMALNAGDTDKAMAFYEAALRRENSADEQREIQAAFDKLRQQQAMYDNSEASKETLAVRKFEKSYITKMELQIEGVPPEVFDPKRTDLEEARKEFLPLLLKRSDARADVENAERKIKEAQASKNREALAKAKKDKELADAEKKKAEQLVVNKVAEVKKVYRLE